MGFYKMWGISRIGVNSLAFQKGFCSMELFYGVKISLVFRSSLNIRPLATKLHHPRAKKLSILSIKRTQAVLPQHLSTVSVEPHQ